MTWTKCSIRWRKIGMTWSHNGRIFAKKQIPTWLLIQCYRSDICRVRHSSKSHCSHDSRQHNGNYFRHRVTNVFRFPCKIKVFLLCKLSFCTMHGHSICRLCLLFGGASIASFPRNIPMQPEWWHFFWGRRKMKKNNCYWQS